MLHGDQVGNGLNLHMPFKATWSKVGTRLAPRMEKRLTDVIYPSKCEEILSKLNVLERSMVMTRYHLNRKSKIERQWSGINTIEFHSPPSKLKGKEEYRLMKFMKDTHSKPNELLFPKQMVIQLP